MEMPSAVTPQMIQLFDLVVDTQQPNFIQLDVTQKLNIIFKGLQIISQNLREVSFPPTQTVKAIFVAPEYFFQQNTDPAQAIPRQYPEDIKRFIQMNLAQYSRQFPGILLIPGTIAWRKNLLSPPAPHNDIWHGSVPEVVHSLGRVPTAVKLTFEQYACSKNMRGMKPSEQKYHQNYMQKSGDHSYLKALEALRAENDGRHGSIPGSGAPSNDPQHKAAQLSALEGKPELRNALLSKNTAYAYLNGDLVHKYHKCSDFQEVISLLGPNVYVSGNKSPVIPSQSLGGIRIGIEICLDHACGTLKSYLNAHQGSLLDEEKNPVDIHLILSAFVKNNPANQCMKKDGYLIHSSSQGDNPYSKEKTRLYQDGEGRILPSKQVNNRLNSVQLFFRNKQQQVVSPSASSSRLQSSTMKRQ